VLDDALDFAVKSAIMKGFFEIGPFDFLQEPPRFTTSWMSARDEERCDSASRGFARCRIL